MCARISCAARGADLGDRRDDRVVAVAVEQLASAARSPTFSAAACALMSPMRWSAMRMLEQMMA